MNTRTRLFIASVILSGGAGLATALPGWRDCGAAVTALVAFACLAACLKVKLPGYDGAASLSFVVLLLAATRFSFSETVLAAAAAALAQSLWKRRRPIRPLQLAFNVAALVVTAGVTQRVAAGGRLFRESLTQLALFCLAGAVYYACNSILVSGVVALVSGRRIPETLSVCQLWVLPYYMTVAVLAGGITGGELRTGSLAWVALGPALLLTFVGYRRVVLRFSAIR